MDASSVVVLTTVVSFAAPFHSTTEKASNPEPVTVKEIGPRPARPLSGAIDEIEGNGCVTGTKVASARSSLMRGTVTSPKILKYRSSVTGSPVSCSASRIMLTLAVGAACLRMPHAPATCGAAIDVPLNAS